MAGNTMLMLQPLIQRSIPSTQSLPIRPTTSLSLIRSNCNLFGVRLQSPPCSSSPSSQQHASSRKGSPSENYQDAPQIEKPVVFSPIRPIAALLARIRFDNVGLEILSIALPAALALAADPIVSLVDTAFVGHLDDQEKLISADAKAMKILAQSMSNDILQRVNDCTSAKGIWNSLSRMVNEYSSTSSTNCIFDAEPSSNLSKEEEEEEQKARRFCMLAIYGSNHYSDAESESEPDENEDQWSLRLLEFLFQYSIWCLNCSMFPYLTSQHL